MSDQFRSTYATNAELSFVPGEEIDFCGERYVVVRNFGGGGLVREAGPEASHPIQFRWVFEGVPCRRVVVRYAQDPIRQMEAFPGTPEVTALLDETCQRG